MGRCASNRNRASRMRSLFLTKCFGWVPNETPLDKPYTTHYLPDSCNNTVNIDYINHLKVVVITAEYEDLRDYVTNGGPYLVVVNYANLWYIDYRWSRNKIPDLPITTQLKQSQQTVRLTQITMMLVYTELHQYSAGWPSIKYVSADKSS